MVQFLQNKKAEKPLKYQTDAKNLIFFRIISTFSILSSGTIDGLSESLLATIFTDFSKVKARLLNKQSE